MRGLNHIARVPLAAGQISAATSIRWLALGEAGVVVAMLAGIQAKPPNKSIRIFPGLLSDCNIWERDLAIPGSTI